MGSIVLTSHDHTAKYKLLSQLVYNNIVVSPLSFTNWIPLTKREGVYNVSIAYRDSVVDNTVVRRVLDTLSKSIRIVEVDDLKNANWTVSTTWSWINTLIEVKLGFFYQFSNSRYSSFYLLM